MATRSTTLLLAAAIAACEGEPGDDADPPLQSRALVTPYSWTPTADADDVFRDMKAGRTECAPVESYRAVDFGGYPAFEVYTEVCNYATVSQALLADVRAGERVDVRMWHFELRAPEPAEGYVAVAVDGLVRWEYRVPIPSAGALASHGWIADDDIPVGTPVQFHVHNHGVNSWNLIEIVAGPATDDE